MSTTQEQSAPTDTTTAPSGTATATARARATARVDRYRRRRRVALGTTIGLLVVLVMAVSRTAAPDTTPPAQAAEEPAQGATGTFDVTGAAPSDQRTAGLLADAVAAAEQHHVATGSYRGADTGLTTAAGTDTIVLFALPDTHGTAACTYLAIDQGSVGEVNTDPSGRACAASAIAQLQVALDAQSVDTAAAAQAAADTPELLQRAAAMASRAADYNRVEGRPSFLGIESLPLDGIATRPAHDDRHLVLRTTLGPCFEATVATNGQLGPVSRC